VVDDMGSTIHESLEAGPFVTRLVSGALCEGWTPSLVDGPKPEGVYAVGEFGGKYTKVGPDCLLKVYRCTRTHQPPWQGLTVFS